MAKARITLEDLVLLKAEAHGFSMQSRQPKTSLLSGRHASRLRGRGMDFAELRGYRPGDDIRAIDWKATARRGRTQIRVFEEEKERPTYLVVDQRPGMFFGSRRATKSVTAAEAAAVAAWKAAAGGDRVGGWVLGLQETPFCRPRRGSAGVLRLLHRIAEQNQQLKTGATDDGAKQLNRVLARVEETMTHSGLLVLITDLHGANGETGDRLTRISRHNDVVVAPVYDPLGIQLVGCKGMVASDGRRSIPVPEGAAFSRGLREEFQREASAWQTWFRRLRIPMLPLATDLPVADQIRRAFGGKG